MSLYRVPYGDQAMKNLVRCSAVFFVIFSYGFVMAGDIPVTASEDQKAAISEIEKTSSKGIIS
jgi:hypothetical protein